MKPSEWIDRLKAARGWESDYRVAKELGLSRNTISNYRSGKYTLDEDTAIKVAEALGEKPAVVLFDQMRERSKNEVARSALTDAIKKLGGMAASILLTAGMGIAALGAGTGSAQAATKDVANSGGANIHRMK